MANRFSGKRKQVGVTLIEILVAAVILTIGLFMVYNIFPMGFAASYRSRNKAIASQLAQEKLEEILQNRNPIDQCPVNSGGVCKFRPPTTHTAETVEGGYNILYNCGYYYGKPGGSTGAIQAGTLDWAETGATLDADNWVQFPSHEGFWYHITVTPVLDPTHNYPTYVKNTDRLTMYRDFGSLQRVTVRVRGYVDDMSNWSAATTKTTGGGSVKNGAIGTGQDLRLPIEVILSTFVANKYLASSKIITSNNNSNNDDDWAATQSECLVKIAVEDVRNFTFFNELYETERTDPSYVFRHVNKWIGASSTGYPDVLSRPTYGTLGSTIYDPDEVNLATKDQRAVLNFGNPRAQDNVVIAKEVWIDMNNDNVADFLWKAVYQTNKITAVIADTSKGNPANLTKVPGWIYLNQALYCNPNPTEYEYFTGESIVKRLDETTVRYRFFNTTTAPTSFWGQSTVDQPDTALLTRFKEDPANTPDYLPDDVQASQLSVVYKVYSLVNVPQKYSDGSTTTYRMNIDPSPTATP